MKDFLLESTIYENKEVLFLLIFTYFSSFFEIKIMFQNELQAVANAVALRKKCLAYVF